MKVSIALLLGALVIGGNALAQDDQGGGPPPPPTGGAPGMGGPPMGGPPMGGPPMGGPPMGGPQTGGPPPPMGAPLRQACGADIQSFCPMAQTPRDRNLCLRQYQDRISSTCSSFLAERRAQRMQRLQSQGAAPGQPMMSPNQQMPPGGPGGPPPGEQGPNQGPPDQGPDGPPPG